MNIFVTDRNPYGAAKWLDDKRLNKMIIETVQLLSHVFNGPYKLTHKHHPCAKWVLLNDKHAAWLAKYLWGLDTEYHKRFGKRHLSADKFSNHIGLLKWLQLKERSTKDIEFCNCTPYKDIEVTRAYQLYLNDKWDNDKIAPKWTKQEN